MFIHLQKLNACILKSKVVINHCTQGVLNMHFFCDGSSILGLYKLSAGCVHSSSVINRIDNYLMRAGYT